MRTINFIVAAAAIVFVLVLSSIEPRRQNPPPDYNAAAEVSVSGTVAETREFFCPFSDDMGTHLVLRTAAGELLVHVAPARFLRAQ
jgi:hypothetical protein